MDMEPWIVITALFATFNLILTVVNTTMLVLSGNLLVKLYSLFRDEAEDQQIEQESIVVTRRNLMDLPNTVPYDNFALMQDPTGQTVTHHD
jgi:hypothetical protein